MLPEDTGDHGILMTLVGKKIAANGRQTRTRAGKEEYYGKLPAGLNHLRRAQQAMRGGTESQAAEESVEFKLRLDVPMNTFTRITVDRTRNGL